MEVSIELAELVLLVVVAIFAFLFSWGVEIKAQLNPQDALWGALVRPPRSTCLV
jgi:hypothetical protein